MSADQPLVPKSAEDFLHEQIGRLWLQVLRLEYDLSVARGSSPAPAPPPAPKE